MIAHHILYVSDRELAIRDDVERHRLSISLIAHHEVSVLIHALVEAIEVRPYSRLTSTESTEGVGIVDLLEGEVCILTLIEALLAGKGDDVLGVEPVLLVLKVDLLDAGLIGVSGDGVIGDAGGYPDGALLALTLADQLHEPYLILVSNSEGLTCAAVTVVTDKTGHDVDRLAGTLGALQGYVDQAAVVDETLGPLELLQSAPGGLGDADLVLIHITHHIVGVSDLRDLPLVLARVPHVDIHHVSRLPVTGCPVVELAVEGVAVGCIADDDAPVDRGILADDEVGTCLGALRK